MHACWSAELSRKPDWPIRENAVIVGRIAALTGFLP
jgi:hypothetical protein